MSEKRYLINKVAWRRSGPRRGLFRRKSWVQVETKIGEADDSATADLLLTTAFLRPKERAFVYDRQNYGFSVAARYGPRA